MERLTRPEPGGDAWAYYTALRDALERLGVGPGDEFLLAKADAAPAPGENGLGPFVRKSDTSRKAAVANYPRSGGQRSTILALIEGVGDQGYTREEIERVLMWTGNTVRPRVAELVEGGWIEGAGRTRPTAGGNDAEVLVATRKAREHGLAA